MEKQESITETSSFSSRCSERQSEETISLDSTSHHTSPASEKFSPNLDRSSTNFPGIGVGHRCERITSNLLETYRNFSLLRTKFAHFQAIITSRNIGTRNHYPSKSKQVRSKRYRTHKMPEKQTSSPERMSQMLPQIQRQDQSVQTTAPVEDAQLIDPTLVTTTPVMAPQPVKNLITHIAAMRLASERVVRQLERLNADRRDTRQSGYTRHMKQVDYLASLVVDMDRVQKSLQKMESHLADWFIHSAEGQDVQFRRVETHFASVHAQMQDLRALFTRQCTGDEQAIIVRFDGNTRETGKQCSCDNEVGRATRLQTRLMPPNRTTTCRRLSKRRSKIRSSQARLISRLRAECQTLQGIVTERGERIRMLEEDQERRNAFFDRVQGLAENLLQQTHPTFAGGPEMRQCPACSDDKTLGNELVKARSTHASASHQLRVTHDDLIDRQSDFSHRRRDELLRKLSVNEDVKVLLSQQRLLRRTWEHSCVNSGERLAALNGCYKHLFQHHWMLRKRYTQLTSRSTKKLRNWRKRNERLSRLRALRWKKLHHKAQKLETHYKVLLANLELKVTHLVDLLDGSSSGNLATNPREKPNADQRQERNLESSYNRIVFHLDWLRDCLRILLFVLLKSDADQIQEASIPF